MLQLFFLFSYRWKVDGNVYFPKFTYNQWEIVGCFQLFGLFPKIGPIVCVVYLLETWGEKWSPLLRVDLLLGVYTVFVQFSNYFLYSKLWDYLPKIKGICYLLFMKFYNWPNIVDRNFLYVDIRRYLADNLVFSFLFVRERSSTSSNFWWIAEITFGSSRSSQGHMPCEQLIITKIGTYMLRKKAAGQRQIPYSVMMCVWKWCKYTSSTVRCSICIIQKIVYSISVHVLWQHNYVFTSTPIMQA